MVFASKAEGGRRVRSKARLDMESLEAGAVSLLAGGGDRAGEGDELKRDWTGGLERLQDSWLEEEDSKV